MKAKSHTPRWLDRRIAAPGPHLTLCTSEDEAIAAFAHLAVKCPPAWVSHGAHATTHTCEDPKDGIACVVCIRVEPFRTPCEVIGMLVHEAVHVWQSYCDSIGESEPAVEQEAYAVQAIAQELIEEADRKLGLFKTTRNAEGVRARSGAAKRSNTA